MLWCIGAAENIVAIFVRVCLCVRTVLTRIPSSYPCSCVCPLVVPGCRTEEESCGHRREP